MKLRKYYHDTMTGEEYYHLKDEKIAIDYLMKVGKEIIILKSFEEDIFYEQMGKREMKRFLKNNSLMKELALKKMFTIQNEDAISKFNVYYNEMVDHFQEVKKEKRRRADYLRKMNKELSEN